MTVLDVIIGSFLGCLLASCFVRVVRALSRGGAEPKPSKSSVARHTMEIDVDTTKLREAIPRLREQLWRLSDEAQARVADSLRDGTSKPTPWSRKHPRCVTCGTTDSPHHARGECRLCRGRSYHLSSRRAS